MLSDHTLIIFKGDVKKPKLEQLWTTSRSWRKLPLSLLEADLKASRLCIDISSLQGIYVRDLAELNDTMSDLLDKHCPVVKVCRKFSPLTLWFDAMPIVVNRGDIQGCLRGDTDEQDLTQTGWHGYSN